MTFGRKQRAERDRRRLGDRSAELAEKGWWHSFIFPSGERIEGVRSLKELQGHLGQFPIPGDLRGKRVLDVGAWDGWFSFEMERRGAEVVAVDCWDNPHFRYAREQLDSSVDYRVADVYELTPRKMGHFDIVLFFGVVYHLKHPLLALEKVCALASGMACIESFVTDSGVDQGRDAGRAVLEFYETDELSGQSDNWFGPNTRALLALCRTAGFPRVQLHGVAKHRAYVTCYREWESEPASPRTAAPVLLKAIHTRDAGVNFDSSRDEYVSCWFRSAETCLRREDVQPIIGAWGSLPLSVETKGPGLWQANFKLPPGLTAGYHEVRIRTRRSTFSNSIRIAVDVPAQADTLRVTGVCDGRTWKPGEVMLQPDGVLTLWVEGLPENADGNNTEVLLGAVPLRVAYVSPHVAGSANQVNAEVPAGFPAGEVMTRVRIGQAVSHTVPVRIVRAPRPVAEAPI